MTCQECGGTGLMHADNGFMLVEDTCKRCDGYGDVERPCGDEKLTREELNYDQQQNNS